MFTIKKLIFTFLLVFSILNTKTYAAPINKILKQGVHKIDSLVDVDAQFKNIASEDMTVLVVTPRKYLKFYSDLEVNGDTSTKLINKDDYIVVLGPGEVIIEYEPSK